MIGNLRRRHFQSLEMSGRFATVAPMRQFLFAVSIVLLAACQRAQTPQPVVSADLRARSLFPDAQSVACAKCHQKEFDEWAVSQHAHANRLVGTNDIAAFTPPREVTLGSFDTKMSVENGRFIFAESFSNQPPNIFEAGAVIGISPLRQYLVGAHGGRLQTAVISFDPRSNEWFNAQGTEDRQPHEWGFWTNRSMIWNVQCAFCHMTGLRKNYDVSNDVYRTTWDAMGISCVQCHTAAEHPATNGCVVCALPKMTTNLMVETCGSCHSRREEFTGTFRAGDRYEDHYRVTLPDAPTIYYADGQIRDEDFEYGSFLLSRMGNKGVACLDCHNPHTGKLKLAATNNALCLQCHIPPGQRGAIAINFVNHGHHSMTNAGWLCVDCHMPETKYMARDPRRDHGFTSPDPQLTIDLGIPNACDRCHTNGAAWDNDWTKKWYGEKMERPARKRAYAMAHAARADDSAPPRDLLALFESEEIPAWRATYAGMLAPWSDRPEVTAALVAAATNSNMLIRSAVLRSLAGQPSGIRLAQQMLTETSKLVRIDAAWSLLGSDQFPAASIAEIESYLDNICDQPAGALRRAEFLLALGRQAEAESWAQKAALWDPSAAPQHALGRILHAVGKTDEALACMIRATQLVPDDAGFHYDLSLLYGEMNRTAEALAQLKETVRLDPKFGRAWYNLGLASAAAEQLDDALAALQKAQALMPDSPDPSFARATVFLRQQKNSEARAAAGAALKISPGFQQAKQLLEQIPAN